MPFISRRTRWTACLVFATATAAAATTEPEDALPEEPVESARSYQWGLGAAGISQQQSYTGIDRNTFAIPLVYFENRWLQILGPWLDIKLPGVQWSENHSLSFALRTQLFGFNNYEASDAPILDGMAERKAGILTGPSLQWQTPFADISFDWMFDVSDNSKGQRGTIGIQRGFQLGERFMLTPGLEASWSDGKYTDYYYGVRPEEARLGRPAYRAGSTTNVELSLRTDYFLDEHQSLFLQYGHTVLGSSIKDSPLTDRSSESQIFTGYLYRF